MKVCDRCKTRPGIWNEVMTFHFFLFNDLGWSMEVCRPCLKAIKAYAFGKQEADR